MSNGTEVINLDYWAAFHAQKVVKQSDDIDNTVTKAMGVLQEHGVYASFLYLLAKERTKEKDNGMILVKEMLELLKCLGYQCKENHKPENVEDILQFVNENVSKDSLQRLLFAKETLEQMLIYARYGAKAKEKKPEQTTPDKTEIQNDSGDTMATSSVQDQEKTS